MSKQKEQPKIVFAERCKANWQVININGSVYHIKCRRCGTYVAEGGTPKCLMSEPNSTNIL